MRALKDRPTRQYDAKKPGKPKGLPGLLLYGILTMLGGLTLLGGLALVVVAE